MSVPLHKHNPSDDYFRQDAIARYAAWLVEEGEVESLLTDLLDNGPATLRRIERNIDGNIDELRKLDNNSLTP